MQKQITWQGSKGDTRTVTVELQTENAINADGDQVKVACCELKITAEVEGHGVVGYTAPQQKSGLPAGHPAAIGKLPIPADKVAEIEAAIAECKATPEYQAKLAQSKVADQADAEYEKRTARINRAMGNY